MNLRMIIEGHRAMKVKLPNHVDSVMAVGHTLPTGGLILYKVRWFLKTLKDIYYKTLEYITGDSPVRTIKSYIPPSDHIQYDYYDKDTHMLSMEIVTAYDRKSYRKIIIIYTSKQDRDEVLRSLGI